MTKANISSTAPPHRNAARIAVSHRAGPRIDLDQPPPLGVLGAWSCCGPGDGGPASFGTVFGPPVPEAEACPPRRSGADVAAPPIREICRKCIAARACYSRARTALPPGATPTGCGATAANSVCCGFRVQASFPGFPLDGLTFLGAGAHEQGRPVVPQCAHAVARGLGRITANRDRGRWR